MAWANRAGHAVTDASFPVHQFQCDRCGQWWSGQHAINQVDWRGPRLMALNIIVCPPCNDVPFIYNRPIVTPPDPIPVRNPRPAQTNTGSNGWGIGGWGTGPWSVGLTAEQPAPILIPAPPMTMGIDE